MAGPKAVYLTPKRFPRDVDIVAYLTPLRRTVTTARGLFFCKHSRRAKPIHLAGQYHQHTRFIMSSKMLASRIRAYLMDRLVRVDPGETLEALQSKLLEHFDLPSFCGMMGALARHSARGYDMSNDGKNSEYVRQMGSRQEQEAADVMAQLVAPFEIAVTWAGLNPTYVYKGKHYHEIVEVMQLATADRKTERARMAEAAGDLLPACVSLLKYINIAFDRCDDDLFGEDHNDALCAIDQAERAIAKATGVVS